MNFEQTALLLAEIQVIDNRRVDEATVIAWQPLLEDLSYEVASEAVALHRRESTAYLLPAHVRANVERIRTALAAPTDEYGNPLEVDRLALESQRRLTKMSPKAVSA